MKKKIIIRTDSSADLTRYNPPPIGNGIISAGIDYEGIQAQRDYPGISRPEFVLEGIRYNSSCPGLISFGHLEQALSGEGQLVSWKQSLDFSRGLVECECNYESGLTARTSVFCHLNRNVVAIRKEFSAPIDYSFIYRFGEPRHVKAWNEPGETAIRYSAQEQENYTGSVQLFSSQNLEADVTPSAVAFTGKTSRADFFIVFQSSVFPPEDTANLDFDALLAESSAAWNAYWNESFIDVPDEKVMAMYYAAQYNLRLSSTPWSIPTGIFNTHWAGRFFGFDEHYSVRALLSCGHLDAPRRVCQFRSDTLHWALTRMDCCGKQSGAKFPWETLENGVEGTPFGPWMDHIFHMGAIALTVYSYYIYSGDVDFLRECGYRVIRECARFFQLNACYPAPDGNLEIGYVCDFEKLGASVRNPFATSCAAIKTMTIAADCAEMLGVDEELVVIWRDYAARLRRTLPNDGTKFLPHPGCTSRSISMFSGIMPFHLFDADNSMMRTTLLDALEHSNEYANQYKGGKYTTTWYAGIQAQSLIFLGDCKAARKILETTSTHSGCFGEPFEVWEVMFKPWFSTASGAFVDAVNHLLLAAPDAASGGWDNAHFKLRDDDGRPVER